MKKYLFMALAAFAFVSCSNDFDGSVVATDDATGKQITFDVYAGGESRGVVVDHLDSLKKAGVGFYAWGNSGGATPITATVQWDSDLNDWDNGGTWVWPAGTTDFYFFAPSDALTLSAADMLAAEYAYSQPAAASAQKDILYGAPKTGMTATTAKVAVGLNHVMSRISFEAKAGGAGVNSVTITSIKLKGCFAVAGKMDFAAANSSGFWPVADTTMADTVYKPQPVIAPIGTSYVRATQAGEDLFIIPCAVPNLKLEVTFQAAGQTKTVTKDLQSQEFQIGKSYLIRLELDLDLVRFSVNAIPEWTTGTLANTGV